MIAEPGSYKTWLNVSSTSWEDLITIARSRAGSIAISALDGPTARARGDISRSLLQRWKIQQSTEGEVASAPDVDW